MALPDWTSTLKAVRADFEGILRPGSVRRSRGRTRRVELPSPQQINEYEKLIQALNRTAHDIAADVAQGARSRGTLAEKSRVKRLKKLVKKTRCAAKCVGGLTRRARGRSRSSRTRTRRSSMFSRVSRAIGLGPRRPQLVTLEELRGGPSSGDSSSSSRRSSSGSL